MFRTLMMMTVLMVASPTMTWAMHEGHPHTHEQIETAAHPAAEAAPTVEPHQAVIDVHGVVCAICAYGLEKRLRKLPFVDRSKLKHGVATDIRRHEVTLALLPDQPVDFGAIHRAINDGGYNPVMFYLRLSGPVTKEGNRVVLRQEPSGQLFELQGEALDQLVGQPANLQAQLDVKTVLSLTAEQPVPVRPVPTEAMAR